MKKRILIKNALILLLGLSLCLTNGFADEGQDPVFEFPIPKGDADIWGIEDFKRSPNYIFGTTDFEKMRDLPRQSQDYQLGTKVGWFLIPKRNNPGEFWACTGFLVGPDLLMTNHHCLHDDIGLLPIAGARIYMDYYQEPSVDPSRGGVTAWVSEILKMDEDKDYALLRLNTPIGNTYGWLELDTTTPANPGQSVKIIHHSDNRSKEISRRNSQIVGVSTFLIAHLADTESGSSGAPIFLRSGTGVIGIHHSGWSYQGVPLFNAGTLMSHIVPEIQQWLPLALSLGAVPNQTFTVNRRITPLTLPVATGGTPPYTYALSPVPAGLDFTEASRSLSGTPTTPGITTLTYTATDATGGTASLTFKITVEAAVLPLTLNPATIANQTFTVNRRITPLTLPVATGGTPPYSYTLSPLPGGLAFDGAQRSLSGTPTTLGLTTLTYTTTDATGGTASLTFQITVEAAVLPLTLNPTTIANQTFTVNRRITPLTLPVATGGTPPYSYTLSPLPGGLAFDGASRSLSGTPTTPGITTLTYTATDATGETTSLTFEITVEAAVLPLTLNPATIANQTFTVNTRITPLTLPFATGGTPPYSYTLSPLPSGLAFDGVSRSLSGTPTTPGITTLTYTATDATGRRTSLTFEITVEAAVLSLTFNPATIADQTFTVGEDVNLTLPVATGGIPPYTYTLSPLPGGLSFNATERELSGTPTTAGTTPVTYTATDAANVFASLTFTIEVTEGVILDVNGDGQVNVIDLAIVAMFYGTRGNGLLADVNTDGVVDILDLTAVAQAIDAAGSSNRLSLEAVEAALEAAAELGRIAGAPTMFGNPAQHLRRITYHNVPKAFADAEHLGHNLSAVLKELLQLLTEVAEVPETTALLPNYPNPFNPETWIPYHLAEAADVTVHIYAVDGALIRRLVLGYQAAGIYQSRSRAAYWDGKNEVGEPVASGVYFYTLSAAEFTATRKMFIKK